MTSSEKMDTLFLNGDDDKLVTVKEVKGSSLYFSDWRTIRESGADQVQPEGLRGISCRIHMGEDSFKVLIPVPGRHMVYNALAAAAVGQIYGLSQEEIKGRDPEPSAGKRQIPYYPYRQIYHYR